MIRLFALKVLRQVFLEAKLVTAAALVVLLFGLGSVIAVGWHAQVQRAYTQDVSRARAESDLDRLLLVKAPHPLDFISAGNWWSLPRLLYAGLGGVEEVAPEEFKGSFLIGAEELDWVHIVAVILSLLAIFVCYDAVSGEREQGTLRLILAQPVARSSFLIGSSLGLLLALLVPLLIGVLSSLLVIQLSAAYVLGALQWAGVAVFTVLAVLYLAVFVSGSILVSSLCRHSATALLWLVLFWVVFVVLLPSNGRVLASLLESPPRRSEEQAKVTQIEGSYLTPLSDYYNQVRAIVDGGGDDSTIRYNLDRLRDSIVAGQVKKIEQRNTLIASVRDEFSRRRLRQMELARRLTIASPAVLFRDVSERLLTTGLADHRGFLTEAQGYRRALRDPFAQARERHESQAKGSMSWVTRYAGFEVSGTAELNYRGINPDRDLIPEFHYERPTLFAGIAATGWGGFALGTLSALFFLSALAVFSRYDVR